MAHNSDQHNFDPDQAFKDYARETVPDAKTRSGWHIGLIYIGVGLSLPAFLTGAKVSHGLGLEYGALAIFVSSLILTAIGVMTGYVGGATRLSTYYITRHAFGTTGAKLINLIVALGSYGWFGVTIAFFAKAMEMLADRHMGIALGETAWIIIGTLLMVSTALFGFRGLGRLSLVVVPLLFILLAASVAQALSEQSIGELLEIKPDKNMAFGLAVSIIVGGWMQGVAILPDIARYARSGLHGALGGFLAFFIGLHAIIVPIMLPALDTGKQDFVAIMTSYGWTLWAMIVVIFSAWSSNDNNLYSASLGLASIFENVAKWKITLIAGLAGGGLAMAGILSHFVPFLSFLGAVISPVAGIYCADFLLHRKHFEASNTDREAICPIAFIIWMAASLLAFLTQPVDELGLGMFHLTTIPSLDALLFGFLGYLIADHVFGKRLDSHRQSRI